MGRGKKESLTWFCPPDEIAYFSGGRSPYWGPGGQMTVSARCAKALTGINPQRIFGYFLGEQKVTLAPKIKREQPKAAPNKNRTITYFPTQNR